MPALIKPGTVKVISHEGEVQVSITLELNINLNTENMTVTAVSQKENISQKEEKTIEKKDSIWEIPDFESSTINFGKRE